MSLVVKKAFAPTQNILVYTGQLAGKVTDKNKVFLGRVGQLPQLPPNRRYNVRVRGSDDMGNRFLPVQCRGRTDAAGTLLVGDKNEPVFDLERGQDMDDPHEPLLPAPTRLALVINHIVRSSTPTRS